MTRKTFYEKLKGLGFERDSSNSQLCRVSYYQGVKPEQEGYDFNNTMSFVVFTGRERYVKEGEERAIFHNVNHNWRGVGVFDDTRLPYDLMIKFLNWAIPFIKEEQKHYDNHK